MMISDIYFQNKYLEKFLLNLQAIARLADSPIQWLRLYWMVISSLVLSKMYLFFFKAILSFFTETPTCQEHAQRIYDTASQIRDFFVQGVEISHTTALLLPFRKSIQHAATDWDDFIEDYVVASDPEIKDLLTELVQHA